MLEHLEQQKKLTINQWKIFAAATIGDMSISLIFC
jgi:hypothetical protein